MIIGISGKMQSGKDTAAAMLQKSAMKDGKILVIKRFATCVKEIVSMLTDIPVAELEKSSVKNSFLGPEWNNMHLQRLCGNVDDAKMTVREMLQRVGTNCMRDKLHVNVWVNVLMKDYRIQYLLPIEEQKLPNWLIPDVRFQNEFAAIQEKNGILIRINRGNQERPDTEHASEFALDNETRWDYVVYNDGSLEELKNKLNEIWKQIYMK